MLDVFCAVPSPSQINRPGSRKTPYFYRARRASNQFMNRHLCFAADPPANLQLTVPECNPRPGFSTVGQPFLFTLNFEGAVRLFAQSIVGARYIVPSV